MSVASHMCDEGYQPNATSSVRVCRDNGLWSGTIIVCGECLTLICFKGWKDLLTRGKPLLMCAYGNVSSHAGTHIDITFALCTV